MTTSTEAVFAVLDAHAGLAAIVSDRIYPILIPQDATMPAVTFQRISAEREPTLTDAGGAGVENARIRVTCWADTLAQCQAAAEQARLAMMAATTYKTTHIVNIDEYEPDTQLYSVITDYSIWYKY